MDLDPPSSSPRKVRFAPKGPPRRKPKAVAASKETVVEDDEIGDETHESLARKVNEHLGRRKPKAEKKSAVQVAFTHAKPSTTLRTFEKQREKSNDDAAKSKESPDDGNGDDFQMQVASVSTVESEVVAITNAPTATKKKEYKEPWDYDSYYPITLPLRKPYSGDPELLDEAEFEGAVEYDENTLHSASDLGLLNQDDEPQMLFFQFPSNVPMGSETAKVEEKHRKAPSGALSSTSKGKEIETSKVCHLEELPKGHMGKMLVYRSGAVKLKLGNVVYDVSSGRNSAFPENVMAINTGNRQCCDLGQVSKHAVVTPDIDFLLDDVVDLG